MNKSILVIDTPNNCGECKICASWQESAFSIREYWCAASDSGYVNPDSKPDWCPLKPVPKKEYEGGTWTMSGYIEDGFPIGWNACIDEILGD